MNIRENSIKGPGVQQTYRFGLTAGRQHLFSRHAMQQGCGNTTTNKKNYFLLLH